MLSAEQTREFVRLWTAHSQRVFAYVLTQVPRREDAEEILQDTSVTLWEKFDQFEPGTSFHAWACQVAFNKIRNFRRKQRPDSVQFSDEFHQLVDEASLADADALSTQSRALADCYAKLRAKDQQLLDYRYQDGATVKSIAAKIDRGHDAVYKALNRIHNVLLDCVTKSLDEEQRR